MAQTKTSNSKSIRQKGASNKNRESSLSIARQKQKNDFQHIIQLVKRAFKGTAPTPMPTALKPMLATRATEPFNHPDWIFEIKWDGYRSLAYVSDGAVQLRSRSHLSFDRTYQPVHDALKAWPVRAVVDGEIIVMNEEGKSDFDALQRWQRNHEGQLIYYLFDLLWLDGISLMQLPLVKRKEILQKIIPANSIIRFSDHIDEYGIDFFDVAKANELEGIVAKEKNSWYEPGKRTQQWLKMPTEIRQEFVIGGWTESESNRPFRSLLFGYYENGKLVNAGHAGGGYRENEMASILQELKKREIAKSPFSNKVITETKAHWVKPELVAEIKYATLTAGGKIRKPAIFLGFRKDKKATDIQKEIDIPPATEEKERQPIKRKEDALESNWHILEQQKNSSEGIFEIEGQQLHLSNVEKEIWKGITKAQLIQYYHTVAPLMLPHILNRPQSLHIKHQGPTAPGMYIKDMEGRQPSWAALYTMNRKHKKKGRRDRIDYLVCNGEASLLYMINLGCIDINPWTSKVTHPDQPDYIVIDLDPTDDDFSKVIETAGAAKQFFDQHKIKAFPKTSGKTGMHLYLPCSCFDFTAARSIAENICNSIHELVPSISTTEVTISQRGDRLYLDPNQNDFADTVAAPYSVRPYKRPTVSCPLQWKEIRKGLDPSSFTLHTVPDRIAKTGDLLADVFRPSIISANNKILKGFIS